MRRIHKRLLRNWRILLVYAGTLFLALCLVIVPARHPREKSVIVTAPPQNLRSGAEGGAPARAASEQPAPVRKWWAIAPGLPERALRLGLPWPVLAEADEGDSEGSELQDALFWLFGIKIGKPGPLAGGIPAMAYSKLELYVTPAATASAQRGDEVVTAITRLPSSSPVQPLAGGPIVGIYHTHGCESFLTELPEANVLRPDDAHSQDEAYTVVRLGREIASVLNSTYGVPSVHSPEMHDIEGKLGAYVKSEATVARILKEYPTVKILLDIHRDSQPRERTTVEARGQTVARVMAVIGVDNARWKANEAFASELLRILDAETPGISIGIYAKPGQFNQGYSEGSVILEIGGVENTLEECLRTARLVASAVSQMVRSGKLPA